MENIDPSESVLHLPAEEWIKPEMKVTGINEQTLGQSGTGGDAGTLSGTSCPC
jgi:hypothetical protein